MLTNPYDNRRRRYREGIDDESDALAAVQRGLADIDKKQTDAAALREAQRKTARNESREDAATTRQAGLDKQAAEDRQTTITRNSENDTAVRSERAAREAELKRKTEAETKKAAGEKAVDEASARGNAREAFSGVTLDENGREVPKKPGAAPVDPSRGARMREGGLRAADVASLAAGADMSPEALQAAVDDIENKRRATAADREQKNKLTASQIAENEAQAKKAGALKAVDPNKALKDKKLQLEVEALEGKARGADAGTKLTAGEAEGIVELNTAIKMLDDLKSMKEGKDGGAPVDTGPLRAIQGFFANKMKVDDPRMADFRATIGSQVSEYIKSISGATVSEPERADLLQQMPTISDNDEQFLAKLDGVRRRLDAKLTTKKDAYKALGKDTRAFPAAPASSSSAMVTVSDGKETLTIPRADLADAEKDGFKVVK